MTAQPLEYDALADAMAPHLAADPDAEFRYFGGIRFDARQAGRTPDAYWSDFGTARFVLPRVELVADGPDVELVCNLLLPRDRQHTDEILSTLQSLKAPASPPRSTPPLPLTRTDAPNEQQWRRLIRWALDTFDRTALRKVVFARRVLLHLEDDMDPLHVLSHLADGTPSCTHFAVRPSGGATFIGASPERLFRQSGLHVVSEAVAGTRPRGDTPKHDAELRRELLTSDKDRREHAFVTTAIRSALDPLCTSVDAGDVSELRLARGRHLHARLDGTLREGVRPVDLLSALHPTPAVAGVPTDTALAAIARHEPFDRGWYAGPVGWMGRDAAEFTVAIRSGLVRDDQLALYSGAGIVDGSDPRREWLEIEQKLSDFAAVLGIDD
jgi:menaquinone-specific isochorismate synthase